jgi:uncharacterized protein YaaW (UPF0174 family)
VVTDVADHVGIDWLALLDGRRWKQLESYEIENAVVAKVFQDMSALGITLPFAVYMGMSQMIALAIGPVCWLALFGGLAFTLNQPNWQLLTLAVIYVSVIRNTPVEEHQGGK